jgi:hypothetical protein
VRLKCLREIQKEEPEVLSDAGRANKQGSLASHQYKKKINNNEVYVISYIANSTLRWQLMAKLSSNTPYTQGHSFWKLQGLSNHA